MRRQFNRALLPTEPPTKSKRFKARTTDFNVWFCGVIVDLGMTIPQFVQASRLPDPCVRRWRKDAIPRRENQKVLARALADLGVGEYSKILASIMRMCDDERYG